MNKVFFISWAFFLILSRIIIISLSSTLSILKLVFSVSPISCFAFFDALSTTRWNNHFVFSIENQIPFAVSIISEKISCSRTDNISGVVPEIFICNSFPEYSTLNNVWFFLVSLDFIVFSEKRLKTWFNNSELFLYRSI